MNEDARINDVLVKTENGEEVYVCDPYNPLNVEITESEVNAILKEYGIPTPLHNLKLYQRAFVHKSYVKKSLNTNSLSHVTLVTKPDDCRVDLKTKSNDRLEFVGDGVLECITKYYLYTRFPKADEGFMTDTKISLVKNDALGQIVLEMGLEKWYVLSKNAELKNTRKNVKKLGNLFEAFLGAIFLDFNKISVKDEDGWFQHTFLTGPGFQMAQIFITHLFERHVNWSKILENNENYKNQLQVIIQKEFKCVPHYLEMELNSEQGYHMGVFLCLGQPIHQMHIEDATPLEKYESFQAVHNQMSQQHRVFILLGHGIHKIKKKAEQTACSKAIESIQRLKHT